MNTTALRPLGRSFTAVAAATLFAACADSAPLARNQFGPTKVQAASLPRTDAEGIYRDTPAGYRTLPPPERRAG